MPAVSASCTNLKPVLAESIWWNVVNSLRSQHVSVRSSQQAVPRPRCSAVTGQTRSPSVERRVDRTSNPHVLVELWRRCQPTSRPVTSWSVSRRDRYRGYTAGTETAVAPAASVTHAIAMWTWSDFNACRENHPSHGIKDRL